MKSTYSNFTSFRYKLAYDGLDLISKPLGKATIGPLGEKYIHKHCILKISLEFAEQFVQNCIGDRKRKKIDQMRGLNMYLLDKYEVGLFIVSEQNCFDNDYVLFNKAQLNFWKESGVNLFDAQFMFVPSRNWSGKINEFAFRLLDLNLAHNSFKWLFPIGQQATFGLQNCAPKETLILCEGFLDYVALTESQNKNVVGLGSVEVTENHLKQLNTDNWVICLDMDNFGFFKSDKFLKQNQVYFYYPQGKDPYETYQKYGYVKLLPVE